MNKIKSSVNIFPFFPFLAGKKQEGEKYKILQQEKKNESNAEYTYPWSAHGGITKIIFYLSWFRNMQNTYLPMENITVDIFFRKRNTFYILFDFPHLQPKIKVRLG